MKYKKVQVGKVKVKLNDKGQAKETYEVTTLKWNEKTETWDYVKTGVFKTRHIYPMAYQPRNKCFKGTNNYLNCETLEAFSYDWWKYVTVIKGKVVFNDYNYSMTTCKHQGEMRALLRDLGIKVYLYVDMRESLTSFKECALKPIYTEMFQLEIECNRKNSKPETNKTRKKRIKQLKDSIAKARKLGAVMTQDAVKKLKAEMLDNEAKRVESNKEAARLAREARKTTKEAYNQGEVFAVNF